MAAVVDLIDVQVPIGQQGAEQVAEPCVLHNDKEISWNVINMNWFGKETTASKNVTFGDVGAGAQQIDDVEVRAEVDEDLEFGDETGQSGQIGVGSDHFDGHRLDD